MSASKIRCKNHTKVTQILTLHPEGTVRVEVGSTILLSPELAEKYSLFFTPVQADQQPAETSEKESESSSKGGKK